jgi:acetyltransferase-like isoleucine patch superfamily enzyme
MWPANFREAREWVRETPWKAVYEIRRISSWPWIYLYLAWKGVDIGAGWRLYGMPAVRRHRDSRISIGAQAEIRSWRFSNPLGVWHPCQLTTWSSGAVISIGDSFGMTGGVICASQEIRIGQRVTIGANSTIVDTDFHPLDAAQRRSNPLDGQAAPVVIEDDVFIGTQVLILKGVHVGAGAVIGAGSVVTADVPPGVLVAGNPARVLGSLPPAKP